MEEEGEGGVLPSSVAAVRVRVQLTIRIFKTCTTEIYLQTECAHVGLSVHAPVGWMGTGVSVVRVVKPTVWVHRPTLVGGPFTDTPL